MGTPKNITDAECEAWFQNVMFGPISGTMRRLSPQQRQEKGDDVFKDILLKPIAEIWAAAETHLTDTFFKVFKARVDALQIVLINYLRTAFVTPSAVKEAFAVLQQLPPKSKLGLALNHSDLGKAVRDAATQFIDEVAQDDDADDELDANVKRLEDIIEASNSIESLAKATDTLVPNLVVAVDLYTNSRLEQRKELVDKAFETVARIASKLGELCISKGVEKIRLLSAQPRKEMQTDVAATAANDEKMHDARENIENGAHSRPEDSAENIGMAPSATSASGSKDGADGGW